MNLTCREIDVVRLLVQGLTNKQIGRKLGISDNTARDHISSMLKKTSTESRVELAVHFTKLNILK